MGPRRYDFTYTKRPHRCRICCIEGFPLVAWCGWESFVQIRLPAFTHTSQHYAAMIIHVYMHTWGWMHETPFCFILKKPMQERDKYLEMANHVEWLQKLVCNQSLATVFSNGIGKMMWGFSISAHLIIDTEVLSRSLQIPGTRFRSLVRDIRVITAVYIVAVQSTTSVWTLNFQIWQQTAASRETSPSSVTLVTAVSRDACREIVLVYCSMVRRCKKPVITFVCYKRETWGNVEKRRKLE